MNGAVRIHVTDSVPPDTLYFLGPAGFDKRGRLRVVGRKIVLAQKKDADA